MRDWDDIDALLDDLEAEEEPEPPVRRPKGARTPGQSLRKRGKFGKRRTNAREQRSRQHWT